MKYGVFAVMTGYAEVEADSLEEAMELSGDVPYEQISWSDDWEIDNVEEAGDDNQDDEYLDDETIQRIKESVSKTTKG